MILIKEIQYVYVDEDKYLMINLINWASDYINKNFYNKLLNNNLKEFDENILNQLKLRKYLFDNEKAYNIFIKQLDDKINHCENNSVPSFLIVPSYACNLNCTYCYEQTYDIKHFNILDKKIIIDKQFNVIEKTIEDLRKTNDNFLNKDIKITIMWWEPLLLGQKMVISYILKKVEEKWYSVNIITNGVDVVSFIPYLKKEIVDHIQITLDGTKAVHDKRRIFHDWKWSFDTIMSNIKEVLKNWIKTYLRVNVDDENIMNLPELADLIVKNFDDLSNLYPYIYILQDWWCSWQQNVIDESESIKTVFELQRENPNMTIFRKKFHPAEFIESIFDNKVYQPILRHCWAARNQIILDYKWNIYKCWHWIGNWDYKVWTFDEEHSYNEKNSMRKDRSVKKFKECDSCNYRYICGTWCPAAKHWGGTHLDIDKPNCVEYEKLIESLVLEYIK